jgi:hypothetical protein
MVRVHGAAGPVGSGEFGQTPFIADHPIYPPQSTTESLRRRSQSNSL